MTTIAEIKSALHQYIVETDDVDVLNELRNYFESLLQPDKTIAYTTTGDPDWDTPGKNLRIRGVCCKMVALT